MKIDRKIRLSMIVAVLIIGFNMMLTWLFALKIQQLVSLEKVEDRARHIAFDLIQLTGGLEKGQFDRILKQWQIRYEQFGREVLELQQYIAADDGEMKTAEGAYKLLGSLFAEYRKVYFSYRDDAMRREMLLHLQSQMKLQEQLIMVSISKLHEKCQNRIINYSYAISGVLFGVLGMTVIIFWFLFYSARKVFIKPIVEFADVFKAIGDGQFEIRVADQDYDEFQILAGAINTMAVRLNETTISRDKLMAEVEERKKVEKKLEQSIEDVRRSNRDLEQFAYVASHDLQEPLRMVASYLQLLERRYKELLDQDGKEFIHFAVDGAKRMQVLIGDLLKYSRIGRQGCEFKEQALEVPIKNAISNLEVMIEQKKAIIDFDSLPVVKGDEVLLTQLFQNLISNAIKFNDKPKPIVTIKAESKNEECCVSVADNGIGIRQEYYEKIFTIFQRLHPIGEFEGTGMGLSMCKKIIQYHSGSIWVESELDKGTTFYFTLKQVAVHKKSH